MLLFDDELLDDSDSELVNLLYTALSYSELIIAEGLLIMTVGLCKSSFLRSVLMSSQVNSPEDDSIGLSNEAEIYFLLFFVFPAFLKS